MIETAAYHQLLEQELEFRQGKTVYDTNIVMDLVREGLESPIIEQTLLRHGIENVATAGLRITTTVDRQLHETALRALRQELSRLDVRLDGYIRQEVQKQYAELDYPGDPEVLPGAFVFGTVMSISKGGAAGPSVTVDLGEKRGQGVIARKGLEEMTEAHAKWKRQRWTSVTAADMTELLAQLQPGDRVWVSVIGLDADGGAALELEKYPQLQGAALVMRQGGILAMAGGSTNRFFNRAVSAKRTMGSTFKTLLFAAALQLGWNSTDLLDNRRNVFSYQGRPYFPRPDHQSPHERVSLAWTGVQSENLAAVWLLSHLLDHLTSAQFREMATMLDLTPRQGQEGGETPRAFALRMRDKHGILVHREVLEEAAYHQALVALEADFLFADAMEGYRMLRSLPYGRGHEGYQRQIAEQLAKEKDSRERAELSLRSGLLWRSYQPVRASGRAADAWRRVSDRGSVWESSGSEGVLPRSVGIFWVGADGRYGFGVRSQPPAGKAPVSSEEIVSLLSSSGARERAEFWSDLLLDGQLPFGLYQTMEEQQQKEFARLSSLPPYSMEVLESVHDYRMLVTLRYLIGLGRHLGLTSPLEPVLSFPLGSNVVSLFETVRMYEGLVTGKSYAVAAADGQSDSSDDGLAIIERIESPEGEVLYQRRPTGKSVLPERVSLELRDILRNVVLHGTGRLALEQVVAPGQPSAGHNGKRAKVFDFPLFGKTGTANRFTNASFIGFVPGLEDGPEPDLSLESGTTIGVYVGFDDNQPMTRGTTRLAGAAGALPTWCELANGVLTALSSNEGAQSQGMTLNGLQLHDPELGQVRLAVQTGQGGVVPHWRAHTVERAETAPSLLTFGQLSDSGVFTPARSFQPYWRSADRELQERD